MKLTLITIIFFCFNLKADPLTPLPTDFFDDKIVKFKKNKKSPNKKNQKKSYEDLTKDMKSITGFFDFYIDKEKNKVYLSIKHEKLNM